VPIAISVNMLGVRLTAAAQARWKNGAHPQTTPVSPARIWSQSATW
jgi:hypothetical protein